MLEVQMKLEGAKEFAEQLRALKDDLPRNVVPRALREAAGWLAAAIQYAAPVGGEGDPHSGLLQSSIYVRMRRKAGVVTASVAVRAEAYYWRFLELGWHKRGSGKRFQYPFAVPVAESKIEQAAQIVINAVDKRVRKLAIKSGWTA